MEEVAARLPRKWAEVATKLGLKPDEIERIEVLPNATPNRCYREVFSEWKNNTPKPYCWATVVEALKSRMVDESVAIKAKPAYEKHNSSTLCGK